MKLEEVQLRREVRKAEVVSYPNSSVRDLDSVLLKS